MSAIQCLYFLGGILQGLKGVERVTHNFKSILIFIKDPSRVDEIYGDAIRIISDFNWREGGDVPLRLKFSPGVKRTETQEWILESLEIQEKLDRLGIKIKSKI